MVWYLQDSTVGEKYKQGVLGWNWPVFGLDLGGFLCSIRATWFATFSRGETKHNLLKSLILFFIVIF